VTRRAERVGEEIREEVARILAREVKDPRIGFLTVTRADVTPDLRVARVYVAAMGDEGQRKKSLEGLRRAAGYIRRALGQRLRLRHTPEVVFQLDAGLDATDRVAQLLADVHLPEDAEGDEPPDDDR
jgi:ribosome-binding factor A